MKATHRFLFGLILGGCFAVALIPFGACRFLYQNVDDRKLPTGALRVSVHGDRFVRQSTLTGCAVASEVNFATLHGVKLSYEVIEQKLAPTPFGVSIDAVRASLSENGLPTRETTWSNALDREKVRSIVLHAHHFVVVVQHAREFYTVFDPWVGEYEVRRSYFKGTDPLIIGES